MIIVKRNFFAAMLLAVLVSLPVGATSIIQPFSYEKNGRWGYCYNGAEHVLPMYDNVVDLSLLRAFFAQKDGLWSLRRSDNTALTPFVFEDVSLNYDCRNNYTYVYFDSIAMYDTGVIIPYERLEREYRYMSSRSTDYICIFPVKKGGKWGYIDLQGNTLIPFEYDNACLFTTWLPSDSKRKNILAEVQQNGLSAWIDLYGDVVIPWQQSREFTKKEKTKYLKKLNKKERARYDERVAYLNTQKNEALQAVDYEPRFTDSVRVVEVKILPKAPRKTQTARKTQKKRSSAKKARPQQPTVVKYMLYYTDGSPVVADTFDVVYPREGDAVRVRKNGSMKAVSLPDSCYLYGQYDSIAPFDNRGMAYAFSKEKKYRIGLNNIYYDFTDGFKNSCTKIEEALNARDWQKAGIEAQVLAGVLPYIGTSWHRFACQTLMEKAARNYNYYCDPVQIAERERQAAEEAEKKKNEPSGWSILGDLLEMAGSVSGSQTMQGVKELGSAIKSVADPGSAQMSSGSNAAEMREQSESRVEQSVDYLTAQVSAVDAELQEISQQQASLGKERLKSKEAVVRAGQTAVKTPRGSNATRNNSPSQVRNRAQQRGAAQVSSKNHLSSIDTQLKQLSDRRDMLISRRNYLTERIAEANGTGSDAADSPTKSKGRRDQHYWNLQYAETEKVAKSVYESLTATGYKTQKDGEDKGGSAAAGRGINNFSALKQMLLKLQREMRDIRNDARRDGFTVAKSTYETVTVSYN